jgi:hypothetical protein
MSIIFFVAVAVLVVMFVVAPPDKPKEDSRPRTSLRIACIVLFIMGGIAAYEKTPTRLQTVSTTRLPEVGQSFTIDIADTVSLLADMGQRDVEDQLRDWAVYGSLTKAGFTGEQIAKANVGQVPVRFPYLEGMFAFEYGDGRRAVVDEGLTTRVLLFYDKQDPHPKATLGKLADRVRMETGEKYNTYVILETDPHVDEGKIVVTRKPDVLDGDMFGTAYGYVEARVWERKGFADWLSRIDDVTYAHMHMTMVRGVWCWVVDDLPRRANPPCNWRTWRRSIRHSKQSKTRKKKSRVRSKQ